MKLTPGANFTNILHAAFVPIFFTKKLQIKTVSQEELKKHFDAKKLIVRPMSHTIFFSHIIAILR